jgi:hypothetical protein
MTIVQIRMTQEPHSVLGICGSSVMGERIAARHW